MRAVRLETLLKHLANYTPRRAGKSQQQRAKSAGVRPTTPRLTALNITDFSAPIPAIKPRPPSHIIAPKPKPVRRPLHRSELMQERRLRAADFENHFILPWKTTSGARPMALRAQLRAMRAYFGTENEKERLMRQVDSRPLSAAPRPRTAGAGSRYQYVGLIP